MSEGGKGVSTLSNFSRLWGFSDMLAPLDVLGEPRDYSFSPGKSAQDQVRVSLDITKIVEDRDLILQDKNPVLSSFRKPCLQHMRTEVTCLVLSEEWAGRWESDE